MKPQTARTVLLLCVLCSAPGAIPVCKPLLGRAVYWAEDTQRCDTLGWRRCAAVTGRARQCMRPGCCGSVAPGTAGSGT